MIRVRRPFILAGRIPPSKSWLNRALILRSLHRDVRIVDWEPSELDGEDVVHLSKALADLATGLREFYIGESGTGFRFLVARLSLERGVFKVRGTKKLLSRPHKVLFAALGKVGATIKHVDDETLEIHADGWPDHDVEVEIDASESSQFASAMKLAASVFSHQFTLKMTGVQRSLGYLEMTEALIEAVKAGRRILPAEMDASSVATVVTVAVAAAQCLRRRTMERFSTNGLAESEEELEKLLSFLRSKVQDTRQPDRVIFDFLDLMRGAGGIGHSGGSSGGAGGDGGIGHGLRAIEVSLEGAPDLFPCLAATSAFAEGTSKFFGAPHLRFKESDRIAGIARLFDLVGIRYREREDGMEVDGITSEQTREFDRRRKQGLPYMFDPLSDHRLAFAAGVLAAGGVPIEVTKRGVVGKSLPMFWTMIEGDSPRIALLGHRGTGKTEAAKRWSHDLGSHVTLIDLDREIERLAGQSAQEIFETKGEGEFRWFERKAWHEIDVETRANVEATIVACGGGFDPSQIDDSWTRVWLRRPTDHDGRIFLDRPRLNRDLDPLSESKTRMQLREPRFAASVDRVLEIGEGESDPAERAWVADLFDQDLTSSSAGVSVTGSGAPVSRFGGTVTLMPHHSVSESCERWLRWGTARIEIRNDLWKPSRDVAAWSFFATLPLDRLIVSFRDPAETAATLEWLGVSVTSSSASSVSAVAPTALAVDWALDRSPDVPERLLELVRDHHLNLIVSVHGTAASSATPSAGVSVTHLEAFESKLSARVPVTVKAALETSDFATLRMFHGWMMAAPNRRVFLPMSPKSSASDFSPPRWQWYRTWLGLRAPLGLNFWREDNGSSLDQPTFGQWWRRARFTGGGDRYPQAFAAILGDPVHHSRTPLEHDEFFLKKAMPVFAIPMKRSDVTDGLSLLLQMGMRAAAVTAPLKEQIVSGQAVNTIAVPTQPNIKPNTTPAFVTTSTDDVGFARLWEEAKKLAARLSLSVDNSGEGVVVWGGGGVLQSVAAVLPRALYYSASKGELRDLREKSKTATTFGSDGPAAVVWASGETRGAWPETWKPRMIIDLSYTDNSMARAIAIEVGARYVSGLAMFEAQAEAQREFWNEKL